MSLSMSKLQGAKPHVSVAISILINKLVNHL